jgi:signal transduction histidine kinase
MRERVEAVGGTLTVDDADNRFAVTASIPFQDEP